MTGLKIEIAGGKLHLTAYAERGEEASSAATIARVLAELALKPELVAQAFEITPEALGAAIAGRTPPDPETAKLATFRGEPQ